MAVEGNIRLVLADSLSDENVALARWVLATHPATTMLIAAGSLWKLTGGPGAYEQMLMAKTYTPDELVAAVRGLLMQRKTPALESLRDLKDAA